MRGFARHRGGRGQRTVEIQQLRSRCRKRFVNHFVPQWSLQPQRRFDVSNYRHEICQKRQASDWHNIFTRIVIISMTDVQRIIQRLRRFRRSSITADNGERLENLLLIAKSDADRDPDDQPMGVIIANGFPAGFTVHRHLERCALDVEKAIQRLGLWDIPVTELDSSMSDRLDEITKQTAKKLGFEHDPRIRQSKGR